MSKEGALVELRRARRRKRLADIHWVDALYHVYLTALLSGMALLLLANAVGDDRASAAGLTEVRQDGPAFIGVVVALAVAVGLRSGSRGGPLALERADVRHVLLAPVDRAEALRGPALRQVRFGLFVGAVVGALAGHLASHRLPGSGASWMASGAAFGLTVAALSYGAALVASALRLRSWVATVVWLVLLTWAVADTAGAVGFSPTRAAGTIALWPLEWSPAGVVAMVAGVAMLGAGMALLGRTSVEAAERRSILVGQLRFAATLQDIRTVIVLRRQLAMELPRLSPWIRSQPTGTDRFPVLARGMRSLARWPLSRVGRAALLGAGAGLALRGAWQGTTPLVVVAGFLLYVVALDATEPLAQEIDHPGRRDAFPVASGELLLRHVPATIAPLVLCGLVGAAAAVAVTPGRLAIEVALAVLVPGVLGAAAAGIVSVVMGAPTVTESQLVIPPEAAGLRVVVRAVWPPALAMIGSGLPLLAARAAVEDGASAVSGALGAGIVPAVLFAAVCAWVRFRDQAKQWWHDRLEEAFPTTTERPATDG